jgi:hypothetical protein
MSISGKAVSQPLDHEQWNDELERQKRRSRNDRENGNMHMRSDDPLTLVAVLLGIIINVGTVFVYFGKLDNRMENIEKRTEKLEAKSDVDSKQDVQLATLATQYVYISAGIGEIKGKLGERQP